MQITVPGAGAGGTAVAFDCASHGHDVRVFDFEQFPENIAAIAEQGGIHAEGDISGFGAIAYSGHDIDDAFRRSCGRQTERRTNRKRHSELRWRRAGLQKM